MVSTMASFNMCQWVRSIKNSATFVLHCSSERVCDSETAICPRLRQFISVQERERKESGVIQGGARGMHVCGWNTYILYYYYLLGAIQYTPNQLMIVRLDLINLCMSPSWMVSNIIGVYIFGIRRAYVESLSILDPTGYHSQRFPQSRRACQHVGVGIVDNRPPLSERLLGERSHRYPEKEVCVFVRHAKKETTQTNNNSRGDTAQLLVGRRPKERERERDRMEKRQRKRRRSIKTTKNKQYICGSRRPCDGKVSGGSCCGSSRFLGC